METAFITRQGLFEYVVMLFGLGNTPSSFQHHINDTLNDFRDSFGTAYIDDFLVYSSSLWDHKKYVRLVLEELRAAGLRLDIAKYKFNVNEVTLHS